MTDEKTPELIALEKAIETAGGQSALARLLPENVKQQHIHGWVTKSKKVPAEFAIPIEQALSGAVTRYDLRPDIYPVE